jgi:L-threonylcarbamoyladenylate synthase
MNEQFAKILKSGGIGVIPTDTIYGLVGSALKSKTVERVYKVRKRQPDKPLIILISDILELKKFGIKLSKEEDKILRKYWPGKVSIILPLFKGELEGVQDTTTPDPSSERRGKKFEYLHRGTNTLAFRLPKNKWLQDLIKETGPLVAPSANPEGLPPAKNISEAKKYFGEEIDFYQRGKTNNTPSTLIKIEDSKIKIIREGAVKVKN